MSRSGSALPGFYSREFVSDPYAAYDYLRRTGPVRRVYRAGVPVWLVTSYDEVRLILTDARFVKEPARWPVPIEEADPGLGASTASSASTCSIRIRRATPGFAGWCRRPSRPAGWRDTSR